MTQGFDQTALLCQDGVVTGLRVRSMPELMQAMAAPLSLASGLDRAVVAEALMQRERVGSTAFGGGSALPHARLTGLHKVTGAFATLAEPIDLDALDQSPVDIVYALISPEESGADHLKALAAVSRLLRDRSLMDKLRGASSDDAANALLVSGGWSTAA